MASQSDSTARSDHSERTSSPDTAETFLPASSLLFQAPDPARARRRRRVTAKQAAPRAAAPAAPHDVPGSQPEQGPASSVDAERAGSAPASAAPQAVEEREPAGSASSPAASSATSTRRGRRRRKAVAAQGTPAHVEAAPQPERDEAAQDATQAAEPAGADVPAGADGGDRAPGAAGQAEAAVATDAADETGAAQSDHAEEASEAAEGTGRRKRRRGGRGRRSRSRTEPAESEVSAASATEQEAAHAERSEREGAHSEAGADDAAAAAGDGHEPSRGAHTSASADSEEATSTSRRRRRRRSRSRSDSASTGRDPRDEITALKGSTRLEAKRQRRREGRAAGRRRPIVTEAEFLARRESVDRQMIIREQDGLNQIAVLEDGLLVEHYVARHTQTSMVGNVYVGRVQNVLPSMEAAFVDLGKGRNAVLYAGEVNWDAAGMEGKPRRIEDALSSGDPVLVQVTKDPIGHKGARLTSQITLAGRYLVLVPGGTMTGISRKLPDTERKRLKSILKKIVPDDAGVIVRTAAEGASEDQLRDDVERLAAQWEKIDKKAKQILSGSGKAPQLLKGEPELAVRVVRDVFNEDFRKLIVQGPDAWKSVSSYVTELSPDLADRLEHWVSPEDVFSAHRIDEQLAKGFDRKVWLPSGGTLIIDRTEAMTVIDVNTGRFTGAGTTLEETVTRNNLEAAEEIVRQLRLRDIGGMVVIDFVDMVLESNRDLVLRRLVECLGRDRTRHQVTEVTSLGLVQMTRKRVGQGLVEAFSTPCECCGGRGFIVHANPVENQQPDMSASAARGSSKRRGKGGASEGSGKSGRPRKGKDADDAADDATRQAVRGALAQIAAAAEHAHREAEDQGPGQAGAPAGGQAEAGAQAQADAGEPAQAPAGS